MTSAFAEDFFGSSSIQAISVDALYDHEAQMHLSHCKRQPSSCYCKQVHWIWASHPNAPIAAHSGKWMLFPTTEHVDSTWNKVKDLLALGKLGFSAKVAPGLHVTNRAHLICIYTNNHEDVSDVFRVLVSLRQSRLTLSAVHYKTDEATLEGTYASSSAAASAGFNPNTGKKHKNFRVSKYSSPKVAVNGSEVDLKSIKLYLNNIGAEYRQGVVAEYISESCQKKTELKRKFEEVDKTEQIAAVTDLVVTVHDPPRKL